MVNGAPPPPPITLNGHCLLSIHSLQQFPQTNSSCVKCNQKLRSQSYENGYKQGMADLQTYLCQQSHVKNQ